MQLPILLKGLISLAVTCIGDLYCCTNLYGTVDSTRRVKYAYWCSFQPVVLRRMPQHFVGLIHHHCSYIVTVLEFL